MEATRNTPELYPVSRHGQVTATHAEATAYDVKKARWARRHPRHIDADSSKAPRRNPRVGTRARGPHALSRVVSLALWREPRAAHSTRVNTVSMTNVDAESLPGSIFEVASALIDTQRHAHGAETIDDGGAAPPPVGFTAPPSPIVISSRY